MFILTYLTIFTTLFYYQTLGFNNFKYGEDTDAGWGLFLSVSQGNEAQLPSYNIGHWTRQLHLQQCAFVEIGDEFCALFVELRSIPSTEKIQDSSGVGEFFLGLCECATVRSWSLCSDQLMRRRKDDCIFTEAIPSANTSSRVHRRLCDVTLLTKYAEPCNCSVQMANQQLYRTEGFPTCFRTPLPESICSPRGVCGVAQCYATTIKGIHSPQCDPECHERQPFCEDLGSWTSVPPQITSLWSHWSTPVCLNSNGRFFATTTAICRNQVTGQPAIDCIGPGSFCCPVDTEECTCIVTNENGVLKAIRMVESMFCVLDLDEDGTRMFRGTDLRRKENNNREQRSAESDHSYQDTLGEYTEYQSNTEYDDPTNPFRRRLMFSSYDSSESRDRSFARGIEFTGSKNVAVNDEIDDDDDDDDDDNDDNEDDEEEDEEGDQNLDEDTGAEDDGELAENDEDDAYNTESAELSDYVRRARDPIMKKTGIKWTNERPPRFIRSDPSMCAVFSKREDGPGSTGNTGEGCDEPEGGSGLEGPLQYTDYDEAGEALGNAGKGIGNYNEDVSSLAIGRTLRPHLFYYLSAYVCIVLCT